MSGKHKIYTYYEDIGFKQQTELVNLWKNSWENMGFEAIVLCKQHARKHPDYDDFVEKMRFIFLELTGKKLSAYGLSCFVRWLAYATLGRDDDPLTPGKDERFLVSDYDVINNGWTPKDCPSEKLHFLDEDCPCLASGTPAHFDLLCRAFFDVTMIRTKELSDVNHYHDQNFLTHNFNKLFNPSAGKLLEKYNIVMTRDREKHVSPFDPSQDQICKAFHVSHHNIGTLKEEYPEKYPRRGTPSELRLRVIKEILEKQIDDNIS